MPDTLPVHLNQRDLHSLEVPDAFETDDSFVLAVRNHGEASRVHVHLDDGLSEIAAVETTNHYVRANETAEIPVAVHGAGPVRGKIKIVSGYGAVTRWVDVRVTESDDDTGVEVDEELGKPQPERYESGPREQSPLADRPTLPLLVFAAVALALALGAAVLVDNLLVTVGAVAVVVAVFVAGLTLFR